MYKRTIALLLVILSGIGQSKLFADTIFCTHKVVLDKENKILPWYTPQGRAYDHYLRLRWDFIKSRVPNSPGPLPRSLYPQYYFYCAFKENKGVLEPDTWMNDIGEKIPNWFESARLYYAYTGDSGVMKIVKDFMDYTLDHGTSPSTFAWPDFPYTTTNAGDTLFRGFTSSNKLAMHEIQVDHAGEMGLTYYRMYLFSREEKYLKAALHVADVLARNAKTGSATESVWPYRVIMETGKVTAPYGANWTGCFMLLDNLIRANLGNVTSYRTAREKARLFLLQYPMETGYWTDGHSDTDIKSNNYKSNLSASNMTLSLFDFPEIDPDWKSHIPRLIRWTEDNFIFRGAPGEPSTMWGANIVGEQDTFIFKMEYQTARYAAACARWYTISGDESYKEKAYRSLNWVTYCHDSTGMAFESPVSKGINSWWSDCYGECPRMFYQAFAGVPEWAPPHENHILYSEGIIRNIQYNDNQVQYHATAENGIEYLRLAYKPQRVTLNGNAIPSHEALDPNTYTLKDLGNGDYSMVIKRNKAGHVIISGPDISIRIDGAIHFQQIDGFGVNANTASWSPNELEPAIDMLVDSANMLIWRVVLESEKNWEDENDNNDPFVFNWNFYNNIYESPKFQKAWDMIEYLNKKGITKNLMINIMGRVPAWMGFEVVNPDKEEEYVEMLVSMLYYACNQRHLKFGLFGPMNEPDIKNEGPTIGTVQYVRIIKNLVKRMNDAGMGDIQIVASDAADMKRNGQDYLSLMAVEPDIMEKLASFGVHSYGGLYFDMNNAIKESAAPDKKFWMTEWNAWRDGLDAGVATTYNYTFASECVHHLLQLLKGGASAAMVWEGYDSYYEHPPSTISLWGILGYNLQTRTYTPRKHFYAISQVSKFVLPGSLLIGTSETGKNFPVAAFYDTLSGRVSITGINATHRAVSFTGSLAHLPEMNTLEMYYTDSLKNVFRDKDISITGKTFFAAIPANCIYTFTGKAGSAKSDQVRIKPEPSDWYAGDIHVHRDCGGSVDGILPESKLTEMMDINDLAVISVLADMGDAEVKDSKTDLPKVNGKDAPQSIPGRIVHYDAEWHWDPAGTTFEHKALGGHIVLLGLTEAHQIWDESPYKILEYGRRQNGIVGFCHTEYLNDQLQNELNCCIPIEYPVEAALGTTDFFSEDVYGTHSPTNGNYNADATIHAYYKLLNCGIRLGLAAGTDYPCNGSEPFGTLLTYVQVDAPFTYQKWVEGIKNGKTVVARNGHQEFIEMKVNGQYHPGADIKLKSKETVHVEVTWTSVQPLTGALELVCNGKVIARQEGNARPGKPIQLNADHAFLNSGWICARRMDDKDYQTHTAPVYITVKNRPVRASADDAQYFINWIDNLLEKTSPGGPWNQYFTHDLDVVQGRYKKARDIYAKIAAEARAQHP